MPKTVFDERYIKLIDSIVSYRTEQNIKQSEVAAKLGWDQSYISKVERYVRRIDVLEYFLICDALGLERRSALEIIETVLNEVPE